MDFDADLRTWDSYNADAGYYDAFYLKALQVRTLLRRDYDQAFERADVIAMPTTPTPPFRLGEKTDDPLQMYLADIFTVPANLADLIAKVRATGAELGIALDGDADRVGAVDGQGRIIWGDQLVMLFARDILTRKPNATFVSEVKCSQALFDDINARGGRAIMWKVGHSLIKAKMKEEKADLAGEMSGHMFFAERWFGFDDAVYAGMRLVELLTRSQQTLAELYDTLPVLYNTPEIRMTCPDDLKFDVVKRAQAWFRERYPIVDIDGVRVQFQDGGKNVGWGLIRASNTGAVLVLRFEADNNDRLAEIKALVEGRLAQIMAEMGAPPPQIAAH
jgi:phosphomannomutase/phosphoglucomutase